MDQFERQFEHLDVQTQTMDEAMSGVTTLTIPEVSPLHFHPPPFPLTPLPVSFLHRIKLLASCNKHQMRLGMLLLHCRHQYNIIVTIHQFGLEP